MSYSQLDSLKLNLPLQTSPTSPTKTLHLAKSKRHPRQKRDTLELIFPSKDPLKSEPDHLSTSSPRQQPDSEYIFLSRKKAIEFLKTDHMIKHSRSSRRLSRLDSSPKEKKPEGQRLLSSPRHQNSSPIKPSISTQEAFFTFSENNREPSSPSIESPSRRFQTKAVYDNLVSAVENNSVRSKYNPLSARSLTTYQTLGNDSHTERIKALQHRIYGMDHFNIRRINGLLHQQTANSQRGESNNNGIPASPLMSPRTRLIAESKKKSLPLITNISLKKVLEDKDEEFEEQERNKISDYYIYDYDNVNNEYHFTDPDISEYHDIIKSLTSYQSLSKRSPSKHTTTPSPFKEERLKSKSYSSQKPLLRIKTDQYFDDSNAGQEFSRLSQKKEAAKKLRLIPMTSRKEESCSPKNRFMGKAVLSKSPTEPNLGLFNRRTMTESFCRSSTTRDTKTFEGNVGESGMKNLEKLCLQFGKQNKKMLKNFEKHRMEATKDYDKLNQKMETVKPYWLVEGN